MRTGPTGSGPTSWRIDGETGEFRFFETPTRNAVPRRGKMDNQDRFWFGEYNGDRIGMFDTANGNVPGVAGTPIFDAVRRLDPRQERLRLCYEQTCPSACCG